MDKNRLSVSVFHGYNSIGMKRAFQALPTVNSERLLQFTRYKIHRHVISNLLTSSRVILINSSSEILLVLMLNRSACIVNSFSYIFLTVRPLAKSTFLVLYNF